MSDPIDVDLTTINNGTQIDLGETELPAGSYNQIRFVVSDTAGDNYVVVQGDTTEHPLTIPSGTSSGLKINYSFEVGDQATTTLTLDFKTDMSLSQADDGSFKLKPVVKVKK